MNTYLVVITYNAGMNGEHTSIKYFDKLEEAKQWALRHPKNSETLIHITKLLQML